MQLFKVLSIDGGGIRGVIPAVLLDHIERETKKSITNLFDLIVGTSTGGIIAAALTRRNGSQQRKKLSASDLVALYTEHGKDIFPRSLWKAVTSLGGLAEEAYDHGPLVNLLKNKLGDSTLKNCNPPIVVTSYDIEQRKPYFFKTTKAKSDNDRNHYLRDVARATSAGPTYFEPAVVTSFATPPTKRVLIDGGVFVNNPAMCAYVESLKSFNKVPEEILLVSIGTGDGTRPIWYDEAKDWGALSWVHPLIGVMMDGSSDAVDYHLRLLLPGENTDDQRYFRLTTKLNFAKDDLDEVSAGNIRNLKTEARQIIKEEKKEEIKRLLGLLSD